MRFDVVVSTDAERDLEDIYKYISEHDGMAHADHVLAKLEDTCRGLANLPQRGNIPKELVRLGIAEYREVHFKPYRIIYRIMERRVVVYCVVDGRRDMQSLLQRRLLR
jgi:toxin ParE1/3/4